VFFPKSGRRIDFVGGEPVADSHALGAGGAGSAGAVVPDFALGPNGTPAGTPASATVTSPVTAPALAGKTPLELPGTVAPAKPPPPAAPLMLAEPPALKMLAAPEYVDIGPDLQPHIESEFGADASSGLTWSVGPDGTMFATPPLPNVPLYFPEGALPPGQFFQNRPPVSIVGGTLQEGFTPFDVLPTPKAGARSLPQVRSTRGGNKARGSAGEKFLSDNAGGQREVTYDLPNDLTRRMDLATRTLGGTLDQEAKNYLRYVGGAARTVNEVTPTAFLRTEIVRDAMIMQYYPDHQAVWVFLNAPPSAELMAELAQAGIPWRMYSDRVPFLNP
jgi:hypothetical protein